MLCYHCALSSHYTQCLRAPRSRRTACKGLVELIVLNIGLNAKILNSQVFAMFVFMAL